MYIYIAYNYTYTYIYIYSMYSHRALRILKRLPGGRSRFADESGAQLGPEGYFGPLGPRG